MISVHKLFKWTATKIKIATVIQYGISMHIGKQWHPQHEVIQYNPYNFPSTGNHMEEALTSTLLSSQPFSAFHSLCHTSVPQRIHTLYILISISQQNCIFSPVNNGQFHIIVMSLELVLHFTILSFSIKQLLNWSICRTSESIAQYTQH